MLDDFLRGILDDPKDNDSRLVYADWLEEQGDLVSTRKAEYLRTTVAVSTDATKNEKGQRKRLRRLAAQLDPKWLAVVSKLAIENCGGKRPRGYQVRFDYVCDRRWEDLKPTEDQTVRFCDSCKQDVHYCDTIIKARGHAWDRHCIAVDLGVIRREHDLEPADLVMGMVSDDFIPDEDEG